MDEVEKLAKNLAILRKNRENVPESVLRSKYASAYMGIRKEIENEANFFIDKWGKWGRNFLKGDEAIANDYVRKVNEFLRQDRKENGEKSLGWRMHLALYEHYDIDEFMNVCADMHVQTAKFYVPYWNSKCRIRDGRIYNDIIGFWWEEESGCWIRDGENGPSFTLMIQAPEELRREAKKNA